MDLHQQLATLYNRMLSAQTRELAQGAGLTHLTRLPHERCCLLTSNLLDPALRDLGRPRRRRRGPASTVRRRPRAPAPRTADQSPVAHRHRTPEVPETPWVSAVNAMAAGPAVRGNARVVGCGGQRVDPA